MRNVIAVMAAVAFVATLVITVRAADMTVKGDIVDVACATDKKLVGKPEDIIACSIAAAKKGDPIGVKTADALYTITGEVTEKDGVKSINVKSIRLAS